jgi:glycosyltransferase involved in cell wall biosynthesis
MDISVVTGTYNRLRYLTQFIESVRFSIGIGLDYEIIIVDGGSTDGTQAWCKSQSDVVLIEQRELLGAIKAFNAGCNKAIGEYVIIANDDIEFIKYSILNAYSFMQDNPATGIGCFQQDRNNKEMHVEVMPVVLSHPDGKFEQSYAYYGQVCIVPRWLGDKVDWWGNTGARTYGGDNELSCTVYDAGYTITPLPCACIHDHVAEDDLRKLNHDNPEIVYSEGGTHPDTEIWKNNWTNEHGLGPIIVKEDMKKTSPVERKMRIHYTPIFEPAHAKLQRTTKVTLRKEMQKIASVHECDYMTDGMDGLLDTAWCFDPDIFVMQVHSSKHVDIKTIHTLKENHPKAQFFNWNGDYHPKVLQDGEYMRVLKYFDVAAFCTTEFDALYKERGIKPMYLQAGYEEWCDDNYVPNKASLTDFIYLGNGYSATRLALADAFMTVDIPGVKRRLVGGWPKEYNAIRTLYNYAKNYQLYQSSRFAISDQQWPHSPGYCSDRILYALRSGTCVLQQWFEGMDYIMGLKDFENVLVWKNLEDLQRLMKECMIMDEGQRKKIADAGKAHVMANYSYKKFMDNMFGSLGCYPYPL